MDTGFCQCGCGKKTDIATRNRASRGWIKGKPKRFIAGHYNNIKNRKLPQYIVDDNGCWIWQLAKSSDGYGNYEVEGKHIGAHRFYYLKAGNTIEKGKQLDHLCKNRLCVNPKHIEVVTQTENIRRGKHTKINMNIANKIRNLCKKGLKQRDIAKLFDISRSTVSKIAINKYWI